ncbi:MAG: hypothetical protein J6A04_04575 [Clostridia bacterium]|nr:hypothetical protein [Clostridia bacterium]
MRDEEFRQMYQSSQRYKAEQLTLLKRKAEEAQRNSRMLRETAKKHETLAEEHDAAAKRHEELAKQERETAKKYVSYAEQEETLQNEFILDQEGFIAAVRPVITRQLKTMGKTGEYLFEFAQEDIKLPMKTLNWQDTIIVRFRIGDEERIQKAYLNYNGDWRKFRAAGKPKTHYLQMGYQFFVGKITNLKSMTEGIEGETTCICKF